MRGDAEGLVAGSGCTCMIIVLVLNLTVGAVCFDYCLENIFGKDVAWYVDLAGGLVLGELAIPGALVTWIVKACGVAAPFVG